MFSLGELLVMLDVAEVPAVSAPFPTMEEVATLVELFAYPTTASKMAAPGTTYVTSSEIAIEITIKDLRSEEWGHLHGYVTSYLEDTLTKVAKRVSAPGYRTYVGHGVMVLFTYSKPGGYDGNGEARLDLKILRDEQPLMTFARLFGVSAAELALAVDRNWRTLPSTREMHVEGAIVGETLRLRGNALTQPTGSAVSRISSWTTFWLQWWAPLTGAFSIAEVADRPLAEHEQATRYAIGKDPVVTIRGRTTRRDHLEVHVPMRWLAEIGHAAGRVTTPSPVAAM
jgi:hypothetical protein